MMYATILKPTLIYWEESSMLTTINFSRVEAAEMRVLRLIRELQGGNIQKVPISGVSWMWRIYFRFERSCI